jgi:hypothetical protein
MWFRKKEDSGSSVAVADAVPSRLSPPTPTTVAPEMDAEMREEYLKTAEALGISDSPAILSERIRIALQEENITTYKGKDVAEYLNQELGRGQWEWAGVRPCDVDHLVGWVAHHGPHDVDFSRSRYAGEIPLPVLLTMQKILAKVPEAHFYISEKEKSKDDPFLLVTGRHIDNFIVERWDEPKFRG